MHHLRCHIAYTFTRETSHHERRIHEMKFNALQLRGWKVTWLDLHDNCKNRDSHWMKSILKVSATWKVAAITIIKYDYLYSIALTSSSAVYALLCREERLNEHQQLLYTISVMNNPWLKISSHIVFNMSHYPHNHAQSREIIKWQQRIIDEKYKKKLKLIKFDDNIEIYYQFDVSSRHYSSQANNLIALIT